MSGEVRPESGIFGEVNNGVYFNSPQAMCGSEVTAFNKCYMGFKSSEAKKKVFRESGSLPLGPQAKMSGPQMNQYMNRFPQSTRKGVHHPNSVHKPGSRDRH